MIHLNEARSFLDSLQETAAWRIPNGPRKYRVFLEIDGHFKGSGEAEFVNGAERVADGGCTAP